VEGVRVTESALREAKEHFIETATTSNRQLKEEGETKERRLREEMVSLRSRHDAEVAAHEATSKRADVTNYEHSNQMKRIQVEKEKLLQEQIEKEVMSNKMMISLREEFKQLESSFENMRERQAASAASELSAKEAMEEINTSLISSEQARRAMRQTVKKVTRELETIRSKGHEMEKTAQLLEMKDKTTVVLRLKYEALCSEHEALRQQVHELEWGDRDSSERTVVVIKDRPN